VRISDRISDEQRAEIVGAYLGGATAVALADQFGISDYSVRGILIDAGVKRPSKRLSGETLAEIGSLRASGVALAEIGRRVGVSESTVSLVREASDSLRHSAGTMARRTFANDPCGSRLGRASVHSNVSRDGAARINEGDGNGECRYPERSAQVERNRGSSHPDGLYFFRRQPLGS